MTVSGEGQWLRPPSTSPAGAIASARFELAGSQVIASGSAKIQWGQGDSTTDWDDIGVTFVDGPNPGNNISVPTGTYQFAVYVELTANASSDGAMFELVFDKSTGFGSDPNDFVDEVGQSIGPPDGELIQVSVMGAHKMSETAGDFMIVLVTNGSADDTQISVASLYILKIA